jgi:Flp pilus assembly protein TadD
MSAKDRAEVVGLALLIRGRSHLAEGNLAAAAELLRQAKRFPETKADATNGLGVVYARLKRFDVAARYFREATELEPANRRFAANLQRLEGTTRLAAKGSDAGRVTAPAEAGPQRDMAIQGAKSSQLAASDAQRSAPAVTPVLASAAKNAPRKADVASKDASFRQAGQQVLQQARTELSAGNLAAAARLFRVAQRQGDTLADASNGLGVVYARLGRPDLADRYMQMAAALEPANAKFAANLQRLHGTVRFARDEVDFNLAGRQAETRHSTLAVLVQGNAPSRREAVSLRDLIPAPAFGHVAVGGEEGLLHEALPPVTIQTASLDAAPTVKGPCSEQGIQTLRSCVHVISSPGPAPAMEVISRSPSKGAQDQVEADTATPVFIALSDIKA